MRVDYRRVFPEGMRAMAGLERAVRSAALEPDLLGLVRIRASRLSGCACYLAMYSRDARARGERQDLRGAPRCTARERAALGLPGGAGLRSVSGGA